jgi:hypothetical protein
MLLDTADEDEPEQDATLALPTLLRVIANRIGEDWSEYRPVERADGAMLGRFRLIRDA